MDRETSVKQGVPDGMLFEASAEPTDLSFTLLKYIRNELSYDQRIGRGRISTVYKRLLRNRIVVVKELNETLGILENKFNEEVGCLMKAGHKNAVRFLGYFSDTRGVIVDYERKLLCVEYQHNRSLGASCLLESIKCYGIIKGICEGLYHLTMNQCTVKLDLKPANILLDDNMVQKITDFHLLRGYMAPEFFYGQTTFKSNTDSLGVIIIEILTGENDCLMKAKHKNIVRFLGYCADTQGKVCYDSRTIKIALL